MKTKHSFGGMIAAAATALVLALAVTFSVPFFTARANASSEETEMRLPSSNLITDGGFEAVTADDTGDWIIDTTSEAAAGGSWELSDAAYAGNQAVTLIGPGNKSAYPEAAQIIDVYANTDYYFTFRLRCNSTAYANGNVYFGFASESRENEVQYTQLHRWVDNIVDTDDIYKETDETTGEESYVKLKGYSLYSGVFNTGNHTKVRAFIRLQKLNATIDNVSVTRADDLIVPGSKNLLQYGGFEGTDMENKEAWVVDGDLAEGMAYGFDDVRSTGIYTPGVDIQDKQIEGYKAMYLVANSGVEDSSITVKQEVEVEAGSYYALYAYFSKWGTNGLKSGILGVMDAEGNVLAQNKIGGGDISLARYMLASTVCYTGENTVVYPFFTSEIDLAVGQWGVGLYVDDASFFKTGLDLPEGKTDLIANGDFAAGEDDWWMIGGNSQVGIDTRKEGEAFKGFASDNNVWLSQWNSGDGIWQEVNLKAGQMYKVNARVRTYIIGTESAEYDGLKSPVTISAAKLKSAGADSELAETEAVSACAQFRIEKNNAYIPVSLIFTPETDGAYKIFVGFDGGTDTWEGGMQIGSVSMYETSEAELSIIKEDETSDTYLISTDAKAVIGKGTVTLSESMTASALKAVVYAPSGYAMKLTDAEGAELADDAAVTTGCKISVTKDNAEVASFTIAVSGENGNGGGTTDKGCGCGNSTSALGAILVLLPIGAFFAIKRH